jgi:hypothetical protein
MARSDRTTARASPTPASSGAFRAIIAPDTDAAIYPGKPRLLHAGGRALLHLPAYESGTGDFNRERLFVWDNGRWQDVDVTTWLNDLAGRLPAGRGVWKGIFADYATMKADTPVWRKDDGCPTGGRAELTLALKDERIALESIRLKKAGECGGPLDHGN